MTWCSRSEKHLRGPRRGRGVISRLLESAEDDSLLSEVMSTSLAALSLISEVS